MPRWLWWAPLVVLTLAAGLVAFHQGWIRAHLTETDVINHYAARYVAQAQGEAEVTDCVAQPGTGRGVWLVIRCRRPGAPVGMLFPVDHGGRLLKDAGQAPRGPRT